MSPHARDPAAAGLAGRAAPPDADRPGSPAVIYIGGMLRSGTTLLAQLLGNVEGCFALGEMRHCWEVLAANTPCACGRPARECPFWSEVLRETLGADADVALYERYTGHAKAVLGPRLALPAALGGTPPHAREYREVMVRLVRTVARAAGASHVVDSSKSASDLLFWARSELPVHLVHIYRPPAAVAYSEARRVWPDDVKRYAPPSRPLAKSAVRWNLSNTSVSAVSRVADSYTLIRYEDLVTDPVGTLRHVVRALPGLAPAIADVPAAERGHLLSGNPSLFTGPVIRKPDDAWKEGLTSTEKAMVAALTGPVSAALDLRRRALARRGGRASIR